MSSALSDPRVSKQFSRFLKRHTNGITYMQCDTCVFICRPMGSLFVKHYRTHFTDQTFPFSDHISDNASKDDTAYQVSDPPPPTASADVPSDSSIFCHQGVTETPFACKWCDSKFASKEKLAAHRRQCYHCPKSRQPLPLICDQCGKHFRSKDGFKYHRLNRCVRYECLTPECGHTCSSKGSLSAHMREVHDSELSEHQWRHMDRGAAKSMCFVCGKITKDVNMERHMLVHTKEKPFVCDLCGKRFKLKNALRDHIMNKLGLRDYVCEFCGRAFVKRCYLNKHMRHHHKESDPPQEQGSAGAELPEQGVECDLCSSSFPNEQLLRQHSRRETVCLMCDEILVSNDLLRQHVLAAHTLEGYRKAAATAAVDGLQPPPSVYPCDLCGRRFTCEQRFQQHVQSETRCELCARAFPSERDLRAHVQSDHHLAEYRKIVSLRWRKRIRLGEGIDSKEYTCHLCGKKLFYKQTLLLHLQMHSGLKPFKCEHCGKAYTSKHSLNAHLVSEMNLRKYECSYCGKKYNFNSDLMVHIKQRHEKRQFSCHVCGKRFGLFKYLKDHTTMHSQEKPFTCEHCNLGFRLKKFLLKHNKKYHNHKSDIVAEQPQEMIVKIQQLSQIMSTEGSNSND